MMNGGKIATQSYELNQTVAKATAPPFLTPHSSFLIHHKTQQTRRNKQNG